MQHHERSSDGESADMVTAGDGTTGGGGTDGGMTVFAALFGAIGLAAWSGGEVFLAAMGGVGCLMTLWVGTLTLFRS